MEYKTENIFIKGDNFKPLDDETFNNLVKDIYENVYDNHSVLEDLKIVLNEDTIQYSSSNRKPPNYHPGYLDKPYMQGGKPVREKDLAVYNAVLSGNYRFIEIEGGVRGGKDVIGLLAWSRYLMVCPDRLHMALGSSLDHVLKTVLMSGGFGLFYTIPHGVFIRENSAQRGVYKFIDSYGIQKEILFYGNEKESDKDKFQGFTLGSVYVNETLNQHINGLDEIKNRIASVKQPLIIMTQNPSGESHDFYQKIEKNFITNEKNIEMMEFIAKNYNKVFETIEEKIKKDRDKERREYSKEFFKLKGVPGYDFLSEADQIYLNEKRLEINYKYDQIIRSIPVERFYPYLTEKDYLYGRSMKKIVNFFRGFDNPNNIKNSYDFAYFHYTIDDNISVSEMSRKEFKDSKIPGSASYDQQVLGIRRASEGAVYSAFSPSIHTWYGDIQKFDWTGKVRAIVIDPGYNHPTGMTDWAVDMSRGIVWQLQERKIDFNQEYQDKKSPVTIYKEFLKMVRGAKNREAPDFVIIDPSRPDVLNYIGSFGWAVYPANNAISKPNKNDATTAFENAPRETIGIELVATAYHLNKIFHHESCIETMKEVGSYSYKPQKDGTEKVQDLNDDLVDTIRYLLNTLGIRPILWRKEGETVENEIEGEEQQEQTIENFGWEISRILNEGEVEDIWSEEEDFFTNTFGGFFN